MYETLLYLHSWLRWIVLIAGAITFVRAVMALSRKGAWQADDRKYQLAFVTSLDLQFVLGLILYFVSPITQLSNFKTNMKISALRFFSVEHVFMMIIALAVVHIFSAKSKKATDPVRRRRLWSIGAIIGFVILLAAIPWPFMAAARPLFRIP